MLGSPIALSSPVHHSATSSSKILTSPVVGEFKGWFSNLFNWKPQSSQGGVLYSVDGLQQTKLDIARLLEGIGINLGHSAANNLQPELFDVLLCRIDQPTTDPVNGITLKSVRFRVEFKATSGSSDSQVPATYNRDDLFFGSCWQSKQCQHRKFFVAACNYVTRSKCSLVTPVALAKWDFSLDVFVPLPWSMRKVKCRHLGRFGAS